MCLFLFCNLRRLPKLVPASSLVSFADFPCSPRVPRLFSGPSFVFLSCQMLSLRSWGYRLRVLSSMSGLLVGYQSLSALFSAVTICGGLLPFLPCAGLFWCLLLVGTSVVVVRLLSSSVESSFCSCHYFCGVHPFSLILFSMGSVALFRGLPLSFSWVSGICSSLLDRCPWYLLPCSPFLWKSFVSSGGFCLVRNSGSLCDVVSLWYEYGFAGSFVLLGSQSSLPLGVIFIQSMTRSDLRFPLATGSPGWLSQFCFRLLLHHLFRVFRQIFVACCLVFLLVYVSGVFSSGRFLFFLRPCVAFGFSFLLRPPP